MPSIKINGDTKEWDEFLKTWQEPEVKKTLRAAAGAIGKAAKPILRNATPVGATGSLKKSVRYKKTKAAYGIGVVVAPMGRGAFYRSMVTGGTKPHEITGKDGGRLSTPFGVFASIHHPGSQANPFVAASAGAMEEAGYRALIDVLGPALIDGKHITSADEG